MIYAVEYYAALRIFISQLEMRHNIFYKKWDFVVIWNKTFVDYVENSHFKTGYFGTIFVCIEDNPVIISFLSSV